MGPDVLAAKPSLNPKAALDNRLPFVQRTEISPADLASSRSVLPAVGLPLNTSVNASPTPQSIADLSSAAAKGADRQSITSDAQFDPSANAGFSLKKSLSEGQMEVKSASIVAHMAPVDIDLEKPALSLAGGAQEGLSQQSHSQSFTAQASAPMNAQGGLIQTPAANVPVSLADALMSSDPAQMQSRLQPYQAWTQRFGEVLAQKLALAVKDGNWTVKLNLNPASLGPVGVELQVKDGGIEGQIAATDPNVRQLLGDSMPKLRQSLEALVGEQGGVNIELGDGSDRGNKRENNEEVELSIDLLADEFVPSQQDMASGNILRDGLNVFV
jgi:flagellar hook-length control protein FliK